MGFSFSKSHYLPRESLGRSRVHYIWGHQKLGLLLFFFWLYQMVCILVPQAGIEPVSPDWKHGDLTPGPPGKSPGLPQLRVCCSMPVAPKRMEVHLQGAKEAEGGAFSLTLHVWVVQVGMIQWPKMPYASCLCLCVLSCFGCAWPYGLEPARLLCPWGSPDEDTGVGCHALLQGIFLTQGSNPCLLWSPAWAGGIITTSATWAHS